MRRSTARSAMVSGVFSSTGSSSAGRLSMPESSAGRLAFSQVMQALRTSASSQGLGSPRSPSRKRKARSAASCVTSRASWSSRVIQRARLYAASRCGSTSWSNFTRRSFKSLCYVDLAAHVLVALAAKYVAGEIEGARPVRHQPHLHGLARHDLDVDLEVRRVEAHCNVFGGEFEHHGHVLLQRDLARRVLEFLRHDTDYLFVRLREHTRAERGGDPGNEQPATLLPDHSSLADHRVFGDLERIFRFYGTETQSPVRLRGIPGNRFALRLRARRHQREDQRFRGMMRDMARHVVVFLMDVAVEHRDVRIC